VFDKILVALDGSPRAERVLPAVEQLAEKFSSKVILLRATMSAEEMAALATPPAGFGWPAMGAPPSPLLNPLEIAKADLDEAAGYLETVADRFRALGLEVECETSDEKAADAILDCARRLEVNLITMTTHGRGGLGRIIFGTVAEHVLHHAPCPLLLVRIPEGE
jgi:nucleotide-binding universal stress UspA family protein